MGLPPTSSKISTDANEVTTFKFDFPNFTGTHTGTDLSLGVNGIAGGGTANGSLPVTAGGVLYTDGSVVQNTGAGLSSQILVSNGSSAPTFQSFNASGITVAIFSNQQTSGTDGGTNTANIWDTTPINTTEQSQSWASLSSNQITLNAGTYQIKVISPSLGTDHFQTRFQNITDSTTDILGTSEYSYQPTEVAQTHSFIDGILVLAGSKAYEVQLNANFSTAQGFGVHASKATEVYCRVVIVKYA